MSDLMNRRVLVLNRHWLAVHVCGLRRALSLLYQGAARVVDGEYQTFDFDSWLELSEMEDAPPEMILRTPNHRVLVPMVIVLTHYQQCPPRSVRFNRRNIYERDRYRCQYCGVSPGRTGLTIDHIIPRSRGGRSTWTNVVVACARCNTRKGSRLPNECGMTLRKRPVRPAWISSFVHTPGERERRVWGRFVPSSTWRKLPANDAP